MFQPTISGSSRIRRTPYSKRVEEAGVKSYTVYNHMLLATVFETLEDDYHHLKKAVQVWDVSVERQIEINGPDATKLLQMTTPRDLSNMQDDQCYYIPMVDKNGYMINDPVAVKLENERYWVSIADSDVIFYFKGLAEGLELNVNIFEPDVNILSIQGPKSKILVEKIFGKGAADIKFFRHRKVTFKDKDMIIARSGWSHQICYEIYVEGFSYGQSMWDELFKLGENLDVRAGCPNLIERIESGLLSYGNDINSNHNPYEAGLGKFLSNGISKGCLAYKKLTSISNPTKMIKPIEIIGDPIQPITYNSKVTNIAGDVVGQISSAAWSPDFKINVAIGMIDSEYWKQDENLFVEILENDKREIIIKDKFWS